MVSSTLNSSPSGPREKSSAQPTRSNGSVPLGASTTPSTEMYSVTTILPTRFSLLSWQVAACGVFRAPAWTGPASLEDTELQAGSYRTTLTGIGPDVKIQFGGQS